MKLKPNFRTRTFLDIAILFDSSIRFKQFYKMNETARVLTDIIREEDLTEEQLVDRFIEMYGIDRELAQKDVHSTIEFLNSIKAIQ